MTKAKRNIKGKFIVIYAANNLGKSVQVGLLTKKLVDLGVQVLKVKYPIYELKPTGPLINKGLREDTSISELELQKIFARNRKDFQKIVITLLDAGINIVAEDYTGTGIAWGMVRGIPLTKLREINTGLIEPDLAILLDGKRFITKIEKGHRNEDLEQAIWEKSREVHLRLAKLFNWKVVKANQEIEEVHAAIWKLVSKLFKG